MSLCQTQWDVHIKGGLESKYKANYSSQNTATLGDAGVTVYVTVILRSDFSSDK